MPIRERRSHGSVDDDLSYTRLSPALLPGETHGGTQFVAQAHAFLFIRIDLVAASGGDVLQAEEVGHRQAQRRMAAFAEIDVAGRGMQVAAIVALLDLSRGDVLTIRLAGENDAVDQVT